MPLPRRGPKQGTSASYTGTCSVPVTARKKDLGPEDAPEEMILGVVELEYLERRQKGNVLHLWPVGQSSSPRTRSSWVILWAWPSAEGGLKRNQSTEYSAIINKNSLISLLWESDCEEEGCSSEVPVYL